MFRRVGLHLTLLLGDLVIISLSLFLASWLRPQLEFAKVIEPVYAWLHWNIYVLAIAIWGGGFLFMDVYNLQKNLRLLDEINRLIIAHAVTFLAFAGALYFSFREISRMQMLTFALFSMLLLITYHLVFRFFLYLYGDKRYGTRRVLIVGAGSVGREIAKMVTENSWTGLKFIGFLDDNPQVNTIGYSYLGALKQVTQVVQEQRINEVILTLPRDAHTKLANLVAILHAFDLKVNVRVVPDFFDLVFLRSVVEDFGGMPMVTLREPALDPLQRLLKRSFDLVVGSLGLILALPLMGMIASAIKSDSSGPIIFTQQRVGENGRLFKIYKFRTMISDTEAKQGETRQKTLGRRLIHKISNDPRITRVGRYLRRTSLDELPQLINILKGEMSLVGPRPELPGLVDQYEPWQRKRFEVPQGLTGWWQVNGRADKPMHINTSDDLYYIKNYSLWLDVQILLRTVIAVIAQRGSY